MIPAEANTMTMYKEAAWHTGVFVTFGCREMVSIRNVEAYEYIWSVVCFGGYDRPEGIAKAEQQRDETRRDHTGGQDPGSATRTGRAR